MIELFLKFVDDCEEKNAINDQNGRQCKTHRINCVSGLKYGAWPLTKKNAR
jgi:hypothetical protein